MAKKLIKTYVIEIYEIDNTINADKNELKENLAKLVSADINKLTEREYLKKRYYELRNKKN